MIMTKIALIQMTSSRNVDQNINFISEAIKTIDTKSVRHIFLPETANFIHPDKKYCLEYADNDKKHLFCDAISSFS